jgi:hypothetical protein
MVQTQSPGFYQGCPSTDKSSEGPKVCPQALHNQNPTTGLKKVKVKVKVKQSRNRPGVAQRVPGTLGSQIS